MIFIFQLEISKTERLTEFSFSDIFKKSKENYSNLTFNRWMYKEILKNNQKKNN